MKCREECVPLLLPTHTQGRKRCTDKLPVGVEGPGFKTLDVHSIANIEILAENKQVVHDGGCFFL